MTTEDSGSNALDTDTIVAIASANGRGGVGIVRLSGPDAFAIAAHIAGSLPPPREAGFTSFRDSERRAIDNGIVLGFRAPASFTGEDVVELQGHGSPVALQMLVKAAVHLGARMARPGEFSERAYLNGKLDLAQAEAVADLIAADSEAGAQAALRSLRGEFSQLMHQLMDALTAVRVQVEAAIDFPDEDIELLADPALRAALTALMAEVDHLRTRTRDGVLLTEGVKLVLLGAPNVGKSSVLNRLCGTDRAIVTDIPGTTRDLLHERIHIGGMPVELVDTAGLRVSDNAIEQEGIRRAETAALEADLVLAVFDASDSASYRFITDRLQTIQTNDQSVYHLLNSEQETIGRTPLQAPPARDAEPAATPILVVANKADLLDQPIVLENLQALHAISDPKEPGAVLVSAKENSGFEELNERLVSMLKGSGDAAQGVFSARTRHLVALEAAAVALDDANVGIDAGIGAELVAEHLRYAQEELGSVCGELTRDALLGEIFSSFCIGK